MSIISVILMGAPQGSSPGGGIMNIVFIGAIFIVMYFFMIRPQTKKAKDQRKFLEALQKGDHIVTIGGIHGKVNKVNDTNILLEADTNTILKVEKTAISVELSKGLNPEKKS
jgi:preprotein translocase subunit YajC